MPPKAQRLSDDWLPPSFITRNGGGGELGDCATFQLRKKLRLVFMGKSMQEATSKQERGMR